MDDAQAARAEKYIRLIEQAKKHPQEFADRVARWSAQRGAHLVPAQQSDALAVKRGPLPGSEQDASVVSVDALDPIVKRSRTDRLDSMIARLKDLPAPLLEAKLREVQGEFFKLGAPITYDALSALAAQYLNKRGTDRHYTPDIRATRTKSTGKV